MKHDPKQIVTPYAFNVHPDLLGLPLATPKRRLVALLCDLIIASILGALGSYVLAAAISVLFFWIAIRSRSSSWWKNTLRYAGAAAGTVLVFIVSMGILDSGGQPSEEQLAQLQAQGIVAPGADVNWEELGKTMEEKVKTGEASTQDMVEQVIDIMDNPEFFKRSAEEPFLEELPENFVATLSSLSVAVEQQDSLRADSLRASLAGIIAKPELDYLKSRLDDIEDQVDDLEDERDDLRNEIENPSMYRAVKAGFSFLGLQLGWIGLYFITSLAFFKGRTLGKKLFGLQVRRLNNEPIGLWFSFERFGGYAAGFATGLLGFFQIYWDANRQGIHDKIAGTVVVDLRAKKMEKTKEMRTVLYEQENLIS